MAGALEGIRILDLTRYLPGSFSTLILADMGADVIRVEVPERQESPREGFSPRRGFGPAIQLTEEEGIAYFALTRNKRSITLDLKNQQEREVYYQLVKKANVVAEDFRPGVAERLKIDFETLKKFNPDIIYCAISGYGHQGPYSLLPGFDPNFASIGGLLGISGDKEGNHVLPGLPVADLVGGTFGAIGIALGILARMKGEGGQFIDVSITDAITYLIGVRLGPLFFSKGVVPRRGRRLPHVYKTKDEKFLSFSFGTIKFWENTCHVLDLEQYIPHWHCIQALGLEDFMENPEEVKRKQEEIVSSISRRIATKDRDGWLAIFSKADVCASPVYTLEETFSDPHIICRNMVKELEHPKLGKVRQVGIPIKMSKTPGEIRRFAPAKGQHTQEILQDLETDRS